MPDSKSTFTALDVICADLATKPIETALATAKAQLMNIDPTNSGAVAFVNNLVVLTGSTVQAIIDARAAAYAAANPPPAIPSPPAAS